MSEAMPRKVIGPSEEDIARAQSDYIDPMTMGMLKLSSSEEHGSPIMRRAIGAGVVAGALSQNGAASSAIAPQGLTESLPNVHAVASPAQDWETPEHVFSSNPEDMVVGRDGVLRLRINNDYQRGFATDVEDAVDSTDQIDEFIDQNRDSLSNPDLIEDVDVTGLVSANDNRENLGEEGVMELQTPGPDLDGNGETEQVKLARERYQKAKDSLVDRVQDEFGYDISDKIKPFDPAVGTHEDSFTDKEVVRVMELQEKYKDRFDSVEQMIDYFEGNFGTPRDVPDDVAEFLDHTVAREQGAKIKITLREEKPDIPPIGKKVSESGPGVMAQLQVGVKPEQQDADPYVDGFRRTGTVKPGGNGSKPIAKTVRLAPKVTPRPSGVGPRRKGPGGVYSPGTRKPVKPHYRGRSKSDEQYTRRTDLDWKRIHERRPVAGGSQHFVGPHW